jgi:EspA/EspE family
VSALDGFLSTWSGANATFGQGAPTEGARFDQSGQLSELRDRVTSAAPGSTWTGSGADRYADANVKHANMLGALGSLDNRLGTAVDRSAAVVAAGRRDLDAVKKWVVDAAATVPNTPAGQQMLYPVVSKGAKDIHDILNRSNGDMAEIAKRIRGIGAEYDKLGGDDGHGGQVLDVKGDGKLPDTTLDLNDIVRKRPGDLGDPGFKELIPHSGVWVPDPSSRFYSPTPVEKPLDLDDIVQLAPSQDGKPVPGPNGYIELVPQSGTWVPDPNDPKWWPTDPPTAPVDLNKIVVAKPGALGQPWDVELIPGSGVWVPDPHFGDPH